MTPDGLLHSDICGSMPAYGYPQHFAVCCVLLRLSVPRHSPCALCSLTMFFLWFFLKLFKIAVLFLPVFLLFKLYFACFIQFSKCDSKLSLVGGLKWTRTTDLTLIRRAL